MTHTEFIQEINHFYKQLMLNEIFQHILRAYESYLKHFATFWH